MSGKVAVSDLHSRLDYLVAYSSQLVFVASDDLQFQQSTLQSFIAQQPESFEVAFLKGEPDRVDEDYRKEICRQILHKITGQFGDSLRNELKDFEGVDNPILICLSASQHLSKTLLKELWELVLFARTLRKNLHVNVILFGDSKWVVQAKTWLPTNKGNKPVLLSADLANSENATADGDNMTELDTLIANKRAAFAQRVEERTTVASSKEHSQSLIQTRKFQIAVGIIFFITFIALVLWFYPQQSEQETRKVSEVEHKTGILEPVLEEISAEELNETSSRVSETDIESQVESKLEQELVTQWDNPASTEIPSTATEDEVETSQAEELIAEPSTESAETTETVETQNTTPTSTSVHPLAKVEQGQFLIQITATSNLMAAEAFIEDNSLQESTWVYTTTRFGGPWYVIVYKKLFKSKVEARSDIPKLSNLLKVSSPFVKSIENVQEEIAIAN